MRKLNEFEKNLLERIQNGEGNTLINLIDPFLEGVLIEVDRESRSLEINIVPNGEQIDAERTSERINEIVRIVVTTVSLLKLLEQEGFIILYQISTDVNEVETFGQGAVNVRPISFNFSDEEITELVIEFTPKRIAVTPELSEYIERGFITREEKRHRNNINLAWAGVITAFVATLMNLGFNISEQSNPQAVKLENRVTLVDSQLNKLLDEHERNLAPGHYYLDTIKELLRNQGQNTEVKNEIKTIQIQLNEILRNQDQFIELGQEGLDSLLNK